MHIALHPFEKRKITVDDYIKEFGHRYADSRMPDTRPRTRCPFCDAPLNISAEANAINRTPHFAHSPNSGVCPTKAPAGAPFINLTPRNPDLRAAQEVKRAFRLNWKRHYGRLQEMVPCLSVTEFLGLLDFANRRRAWEYRGMREEDIPYVLVVLADYPPWTGIPKNGKPLRKFWFRFWYQNTIQHIEQLWIEGPVDATLFRASLLPPKRRNGLPNIERDVANYYPIPTPRDFLAQAAPNLHEFVVEKVENWFAQRPQFESSRRV